MARPELGDTPFGRGIKNPKNQAPAPKATPTPAPASTGQRLKRAFGNMTYLPAHKVEGYITDSLKKGGGDE